MSIENIKPGDLIVIQPRKLMAHAHVGVITPVYGNMVLYEYTTQPRQTCVRTGRTEPVGLQAHFLKDFLDGPDQVSCHALVRGLYLDEEDRLLTAAEVCLGRGPDAWGGSEKAADRVNAATFVAHLWRSVGVMQYPCLEWSANSLISFARKQGIVSENLSLN